MKKTIYIASSWKNQHGVEMLTKELRKLGYIVISWIENNFGEVHGPDKKIDFEKWVKTKPAFRSFDFDTKGVIECDIFIYYSPAGKDAAAECGMAWADMYMNRNEKQILMLHSKGEDFGLMRKMFDTVFTRHQDLIRYLDKQSRYK